MDVVAGKIVVPVFPGLGTAAAISDAWRNQSLSDYHSPSGSLLLQSCYRAFLEELASLSSNDLHHLGISFCDFPAPASLLTHEENTNHIVLSHSFLFLSQALRWLSLNDSSHQGAFVQPFDPTVGCLAFSLGALFAPVVASSTTLLDYLSTAVEAYKVTLWIGIRIHLYHHGNPSSATPRDSSWSIVCTGVNPIAAQQLVTDFRATVSDTSPPTASPNSLSLESRAFPSVSHRHALVIRRHHFRSSSRSSCVRQDSRRHLFSAPHSHLCFLSCHICTQGDKRQSAL